jgi:hypothetical protein
MSLIYGVSGCILDFVVFYISKVGVGFTLLSEPMHHPFGDDAPHIKLWGASFLNCPVWTAWECQPSRVIWLHWLLCIFRPWFLQRNPVVYEKYGNSISMDLSHFKIPLHKIKGTEFFLWFSLINMGISRPWQQTWRKFLYVENRHCAPNAAWTSLAHE